MEWSVGEWSGVEYRGGECSGVEWSGVEWRGVAAAVPERWAMGAPRLQSGMVARCYVARLMRCASAFSWCEPVRHVWVHSNGLSAVCEPALCCPGRPLIAAVCPPPSGAGVIVRRLWGCRSVASARLPLNRSCSCTHPSPMHTVPPRHEHKQMAVSVHDSIFPDAPSPPSLLPVVRSTGSWVLQHW